MASLLSRSSLISKLGIRGPNPFCWPTVWRFFSQSRTRYAAPKDPEARRNRLNKDNERQRQRYHNDPDYREKKTAMSLLRHHNDPAVREHELEAMRLRNQIWRTQNPEAHAESNRRYLLELADRRANDPRYNFRGGLHSCLIRNAWARDELPWKAHVPVVSKEKVLRRCAGRDRLSHLGSFRLWYVHPLRLLDMLRVDAATRASQDCR